ncbi:hypothetical protein PG995_006600 [Apiospora arundinis]
MKNLLVDVFHGYGGITADLKKLFFRAPFHAFYYRWERFWELLALQKQQDPPAAAYSQILFDIVERELKDTMEEANHLVSKGPITHDLLWTIFEPGTRVYSYIDGLDRFFMVQDTKQGDTFKIHARHTDWNGHLFGLVSKTLFKELSSTMPGCYSWRPTAATPLMRLSRAGST